MSTLKSLPVVPNNPQHFYDLISNIVGLANPHAKIKHPEVLVQVGYYKELGIFNTAYGFFFVSKNKKFSKVFFSSYKECVSHIKKSVD